MRVDLKRIMTWLTELSVKIKGKFKTVTELHAPKAIEHSQLIAPQSSRWPSSEPAFPASSLNCWLRICLQQQREMYFPTPGLCRSQWISGARSMGSPRGEPQPGLSHCPSQGQGSACLGSSPGRGAGQVSTYR